MCVHVLHVIPVSDMLRKHGIKGSPISLGGLRVREFVVFLLMLQPSELKSTAIDSWEVICQSIGIASISLPADTSLCSVHYGQVYRTQHETSKACVCCGVKRRHSTSVITFITCPSPILVESYLRETIDFCDTIQEGDQVCYSCYKFLNGKLKSCECMLSDKDIVLALKSKLAEFQKIVTESFNVYTSTESCVSNIMSV